MTEASQALLTVAGLFGLAAAGNGILADRLLTEHAQAALRWGALHHYAARLRQRWQFARRDARLCTLWGLLLVAGALAIELSR